MKLKIHIKLKAGVLDPQGQATRKALHSLGFTAVEDVRLGKFIELDIEENDPQRATRIAKEMCDQLLANIVVEEYSIDII